MVAAEELWDSVQRALQELRSADDLRMDDWQGRIAELADARDGADRQVLEELVDRLADLSEDDRAAVLEPDRLDQLVYSIVERHAEVPPEGDQGGFDEASWYQFLVTNGPAWDGSAESWPQFREWLAYQAEVDGVGRPTVELLDHLDGLDPGERITVLAQYGVVIPTAEPAEPLDGMAALYESIHALPGIDLLSEREITQIVEQTLQKLGD